jgi:hypothetical protein
MAREKRRASKNKNLGFQKYGFCISTYRAWVWVKVSVEEFVVHH